MKKLFTTNVGFHSHTNVVFKIQKDKSKYIAARGKQQTVRIFDRHGDRIAEIPLPGEPIDFTWDCTGEFLAIVDDMTSSVTLWDSVSSKISQLNTGIKDHLSVISWSAVGSRLAVGTEKGNLVIYNHKTFNKLSLLGKHVRKITCAVWNKESILALAGEDKCLTVNSSEGDLIKQYILRDIPSNLSFVEMKHLGGSGLIETTVSCIVGRKYLFIQRLDDQDNPTELAFQPRYGDIVAYEWFGEGSIMVGFSLGYFIVISAQGTEIGKEIYQVRNHKDGLCTIALSPVLNRCATAGDHCVKVHDLTNIRELIAIIELEENTNTDDIEMVPDEGAISDNRISCHLQWSDDGQLMAVSTPKNLLHVFLSQLPMLISTAPAHSTNLTARLTSLLEVTVEALPFRKVKTPMGYFQTPRTVKVVTEPTFLNVGSTYLAVGTNSHAWFYKFTETGIEFVNEYDYADTITKICVHEYYAAACGPSGKLTLHLIEPSGNPQKGHSDIVRDQRIFPADCGADAKVTGFHVVGNFLIYATDTGELRHFHLEDWAYVNQFEHTNGIVNLFPNQNGTRVAFIDQRAAAFMYNPIINYSIELPDFAPTHTGILWDEEEDENFLLVSFDDARSTVYRCFLCGRPPIHAGNTSSSTKYTTGSTANTARFCNPSEVTGSRKRFDLISGYCKAVGVTRIPYGHVPVALSHGELCFLSPTGRLIVQPLATHTFRAYSNAVTSGGQLAEKCTGIVTAAAAQEGTVPRVDSNLKRTGGKDLPGGELGRLSQSELHNCFDQAMRAGCFSDASVFADVLNNPRIWNQLGMACLRVMQFDLAIRAFRKLNHPGLVMAVQRIQQIEDAFLLGGYVAMMLKEYDDAQELFLASSKPEAALQMRRDLLHWDTALQLARTLAPHEIPFICREYATEMEYVGDYVNALMHFEKALTQPLDEHTSKRCNVLDHTVSQTDDLLAFDEGGLIKDAIQEPAQRLKCEKEAYREHVELCTAGVARNAIRLGDWKRGVQLANESGNRGLQKSCADILEQMKQWQEAAALYENAGCYEASVVVYLRCKNFKRAGELLSRVTNAPRLHLQYAKAREADGAFKDAVIAYQAACDWDSVIRLYIDKLGNPDEAVRVVRETKSIEGAKMVAQYFIRVNDHISAIKFLVMSKCLEAAFQLASKYHKMELYAEAIGLDADVSEYQSIACYFESEKNWYLAAKFYLLANQYEKAVRFALRTPYSEKSPALDLALEAVGRAGNTRLTRTLIVYLMGESDGVPKDARHLFRLYMALKQYKEAARTAVIIAREEQTAGNYRNAHDLLFHLVQELRDRNLRVPSEMADNLALLHSYILAKLHVKNGDHLRAAKMLIRVAENISKFPAHVVPILTSTVIECQKAGLKSTSFGYAAMLLRPEYRDKLEQKHRRKFETLVRRPDWKTDTGNQDQVERGAEVEPSTPCPYCSAALLSSCLYCRDCRSTLPYCIITGNHMVKNDFTVCSSCRFPAIYSEMMRFIENHDDPVCPMCSAALQRDNIRRITDPSQFLNAWIMATDDSTQVETKEG